MVTARPRVRIIATGGSIAGIGPHRLDYTLYPELGQHLTIDQSLARIPEVGDIADVQAEDFVNVGSTSIGPREWLRMAQHINQIWQEDTELSGVVMTHGTATMEETAYFLHLTVKSSRPLAITAAMRPPTALGTDADVNLLVAIRIATSPQAAGMGVLTVLNNEIHCARDVSKANTFRVDTFRPNELGFLGYADSDGEVVFFPDADPQAHLRNPIRRLRSPSPCPEWTSSMLMPERMGCWWTRCASRGPKVSSWWASAAAPIHPPCWRPGPKP